MKRVSAILLLTLSLLPTALEVPYCVNAMRFSPAERWNWCFWLGGLLVLVATVIFSKFLKTKVSDGACVSTPDAEDAEKCASAEQGACWRRMLVLLPPVLLVVFGYLKQIHLAILLGGMLLPEAVVCWLYGWTAALRGIPACGVFILSCPNIGILLATVIPWDGVLLKTILALVLAGGLPFLYLIRLPRFHLEGVLFGLVALLVLAGGLLARGGAVARNAPLVPVFDRLTSDDFRGIQESESDADRRFFGQSTIKRFLFTEEEGIPIQVLTVSQIDNIHQVHPTIYCLRVGGFELTLEHTYAFTPSEGHPPVAVLETLAMRGDERHLFWQWFSNASYSTPSFLLFRTFYSPTDDWSVFIVDLPVPGTLEESQELLRRFIANFLP